LHRGLPFFRIVFYSGAVRDAFLRKGNHCGAAVDSDHASTVAHQASASVPTAPHILPSRWSATGSPMEARNTRPRISVSTLAWCHLVLGGAMRVLNWATLAMGSFPGSPNRSLESGPMFAHRGQAEELDQ